MKYIVALTGGIGSGKSTIANFFSHFGIVIIDADIIARQIVEPGTLALKIITQHFTNRIINPDGTLNRRALREYIFSIPAEKNWLNALLHPLIHKETQRLIFSATSPYILWVVPLLIENQLYKRVNRILVVDVTPETQIQRVMIRDNISRIQAQRIISSQVTRETRLAIANDVIDNNGITDSIDSIKLNVFRLHKKYLRFAAQDIL